MSKLKKLLSETVLYGLGSIIPRVFNFLLFPLHTRIFNPQDYGIINYLYIFAAFANILYTFGIETAYFRYATKKEMNPPHIFNISQTIVISISLGLTLLIIVFSGPLAVFLGVAHKSSYIDLLAVILFIDALVAIPFAKLRLEKKALLFVIGKLINILILIGLNCFFFIFLFCLKNDQIAFNFKPTVSAFPSSDGIKYVFLANLFANLFYILFFFKILIKWRPCFDRKLISGMIHYAYPIMLTGLAGMVNEMFSRWFLKWRLPENFYPGKSSLYALGVFSACYKYAIFMSLAIQAFRFAAEPFFFSHASDRNSPELFAKVNHFFIVISSFILLGISINMDILKYLLGGPAYYEGLTVVPILLLSYLFLGIYYNFSVWFKLTDRTYYGTIITMIGVILTIGLNYFLIPLAGYVGSCWATFGCYFVMAIVCFLLGQRYYPIPYKIFQGTIYIVFALLLIEVSQLIPFENLLFAFSFHGLLLIIYVGFAYLIENRELKQVTV